MKYRPEIDGLRAVAVLPVILFHAGFSTFSGGFVGVDVFFVISGYLITSIILKDLAAGTFSFWEFYERRVRRILPALFFVIICCTPFAWMWMMPMELKAFSTSVVAVSVFMSNILFWRQSGYFDQAAELKPLLHTWSLAVEEQFYIFFPIAMLILWRFGRKNVVGAIAVVALVSLALSEYGSRYHPSFNFYWLPTRAWELAAGSLCAFLAIKPKAMRDDLLSVVGLLAILVAVFYYDQTTPFPSLYALLPVLGTCAIILFARQGTIVGSLLSLRAFVGIGLISYSAYLWHQPLFAFARIRSLTEPTWQLMLLLAVCSLVLAYFSWRYIEVPARKRGVWPLPQRKTVFALSGTVASLLIAFGLAGHFTRGFDAFGGVPPVITAQFDATSLREKCDRADDVENGEIDFCFLGAEENPLRTVAVFGDSHSDALNPLFDMLGKEHSVRYAHIGLGGCPPLIGADVRKGNFGVGVCERLAERQYEFVKDNGIKQVFLIARWSLYTQGEYNKDMNGYFLTNSKQSALDRKSSREVFMEAFRNTIDSYNRIGAHVVVLLQVPQQYMDPKRLYHHLHKFGLYATRNADQLLETASIRARDHLDLQRFNRQFFAEWKSSRTVSIVNPDEFFCDQSVCRIGDANTSYYNDDDHVNAAGAVRLKGAFSPFFEEVVDLN